MIWLNGEFSSSDVVISANDRGLLLGEAVFESVLAENGATEHWDAHMARLWEACALFAVQTRGKLIMNRVENGSARTGTKVKQQYQPCRNHYRESRCMCLEKFLGKKM